MIRLLTFLPLDTQITISEFFCNISFWGVMMIIGVILALVLYYFLQLPFINSVVAVFIILGVIFLVIKIFNLGESNSHSKNCDGENNPKNIVFIDQTTAFTATQKEKIIRRLEATLENAAGCSEMILYALDDSQAVLQPKSRFIRVPTRDQGTGSDKEIAEDRENYKQRKYEWNKKVKEILAVGPSERSKIIEAIDIISNKEFFNNDKAVSKQLIIFTDGIQASADGAGINFYRLDEIPTATEFLETEAGSLFAPDPNEDLPFKNVEITLYFISPDNSVIGKNKQNAIKKFWIHYLYILGANCIDVRGKI